MNGTQRVKLSKVIDKMELINLTPQVDASAIWWTVPDINRPALQLTGFYDEFSNGENANIRVSINGCFYANFDILAIESGCIELVVYSLANVGADWEGDS